MCCCSVLARRAQTIMKARLKGAQTGRNLLKKKSDALSMRFRQILRKIIEVSNEKRKKKSLFSSSRRVSKGGLVFFLSFRLRLKWERWWERPPSLWLKPNLQPETSGESRRRITWCIVFGTDVSVTLWIFNTVCSTTVIQNVNKAQVKVRAKKDNVAGQLKKNHLFTAHRRCLTSSYTQVSLCFRCHPSCFWALPRRRWQ